MDRELLIDILECYRDKLEKDWKETDGIGYKNRIEDKKGIVEAFIHYAKTDLESFELCVFQTKNLYSEAINFGIQKFNEMNGITGNSLQNHACC